MSALDITLLPTTLIRLCQHLADQGGKAWLVGGCVRDMMLGIKAKDFDLEVYGLASEKLQSTLKKLGKTEHVGQQFGVFKLWLDHIAFDVALPRSEIKSGSGHRGFDVTPDPFISIHQASLRRDFTINAMMLDPLSNTLIDDHGGAADLKDKILRHVSPAFAEDPLRPLRAMQFAARFQLHLHPDTAALCHTLIDESDSLPAERIWAEWQKWSHALTPSYGLQALQDSGWLKLYSSLEALAGCPQNPRWHPEGNVWLHTLQVCDQAAAIATRHQLNATAREQLMFASLCHDLGKPDTTHTDPVGNIRSSGHSQIGIALSATLLRSIGAPKRLLQYITPLISEHMTHLHGQPTPRAVRRLAHSLEPANIERWEMLVEADASGRSPAPPARPALNWLRQAQRLQHHQSKPQAILNGKILLQLGIAPSPEMGAMLDQAYEAQLDGEFENETSAVAWLQNHTT